MLFHLVICIFLMIGIIFEQNIDYLKAENQKYKSSQYCFFACLLVIIVFGVVKDPYWGIDSKNYEDFYFIPALNSSIKEIMKMEPFSIPFLLITKFITFLTTNFTVYKGIIFICSLIGPGLLIYKLSRYKSFSLLIYYCISASQLHFSLRQSLSVSLICIVVYYMLKDNYKVAIPLFIIAFLIHNISLVAIGTLLLTKYKKMISPIKIFVISFFMHFIFFEFVLLFVKQYRNGMFASAISSDGGYSLLVISYLLLFILWWIINGKLIAKKEAMKNDGLTIFCFNNYVLSSCLQLSATKFATLNRTRFFSNFYLCILVPNILDGVVTKRRNLIVCSVSLMFILFYLYSFALKYPYSF